MTAERKLSLPPMTVEEFFAWDGGGHVGKLERVEGIVRAMAPASANHSFIQGYIVTALKNHLRATGSRFRTGLKRRWCHHFTPIRMLECPMWL